MNKLLITLALILAINVCKAQDVKVNWANQIIDAAFKIDKEKFTLSSYLFNDAKKELIFVYKSETQIAVKKFDLKSGKELNSLTFSPELVKKDLLTAGYAQLVGNNLEVSAYILSMKTEKTTILKITYEYSGLKEIKRESIAYEAAVAATKSVEPTTLPIDEPTNGAAVESKKTASNNQKALIKSATYTSDVAADKKVVFEDYKETGNDFNLAFSVQQKGNKLSSGNVKYTFERTCTLENVVTDDKNTSYFLFSEFGYSKDGNIIGAGIGTGGIGVGFVLKNYYRRANTQKYFLMVVDSKNNQTTHVIENLKSDFTGFYKLQFLLDATKENLFLGALCSTKKNYSDAKYVNNVFNTNSKTLTVVESKCSPEFTAAIDEMNEDFICEGKIVSKNTDTGLKILFEDYRGSPGGVAAPYMARNEYTATMSNSIFVLKFNKKGEIAQQSVIRKKQYKFHPFGYESFAGYNSFESGNKSFLVFNDNQKNLGNTERKDASITSSSFTVIATIDQNGVVSKKQLTGFNEPNSYFLNPELTRDLGNGEYFVCQSQVKLDKEQERYIIDKFKFGIITIK